MKQVLNFSQVDVFARDAYRGNPVAVVHGADALNVDEMARLARWTNLSETSFLLNPSNEKADYRLRIFTPGGELPFAGHPTLGSCHAWLKAGGAPRDSRCIVQECEAGLVSIRKESQDLSFAAPPTLRSGPLESSLVSRLMTALALPDEALVAHQWVDNGPGWCALLLDSAQRVLDVIPDLAALGDARLGLVGAFPPGSASDFEVRAFVPSLGVPEDPVTGSLNASIAQWLIRENHAPDRYVASQGTVIGRSGQILVNKERDTVWIGGETRVCIQGTAIF